MTLWRLFQTEIRREFKRAQAYYVDVIADQVLFTAIFFLFTGVIYLLTGGDYTVETLAAVLVGFITWRVADGCILRLVGSITDDARVGVLEQLCLSPNALEWTILARTLAIFIYFMLRGLLIAAIIIPIFGIPIQLSFGLILVFIITEVSAFGLAYLILGLHLVTKNVSAITLTVSTVLLFLTGAVSPLDNVTWLYALSRGLPLTIGIEILRDLAAGNLSFIDLISQANFYWLILNATIYGLIGWFIFQWGLAKARLQGSLAHY